MKSRYKNMSLRKIEKKLPLITVPQVSYIDDAFDTILTLERDVINAITLDLIALFKKAVHENVNNREICTVRFCTVYMGRHFLIIGEMNFREYGSKCFQINTLIEVDSDEYLDIYNIMKNIPTSL